MIDVLSKEFQTKVAEELKITDLSEENIVNASKGHYYLRLLLVHLKIKTKYEGDLTVKFSELYEFYKYENQKAYSDSDIKNIYIPAHKDYREIKLKLNKIEIAIRYLEDIVKAFNNRSFVIKNQIELKKLDNLGV